MRRKDSEKRGPGKDLKDDERSVFDSAGLKLWGGVLDSWDVFRTDGLFVYEVWKEVKSAGKACGLFLQTKTLSLFGTGGALVLYRFHGFVQGLEGISLFF